jgi:hypothetical protein
MADLGQIFFSQKKGIRVANYQLWKTDNFSNYYTFSNKGKFLLSTLDKTHKVTLLKGATFLLTAEFSAGWLKIYARNWQH